MIHFNMMIQLRLVTCYFDCCDFKIYLIQSNWKSNSQNYNFMPEMWYNNFVEIRLHVSCKMMYQHYLFFYYLLKCCPTPYKQTFAQIWGIYPIMSYKHQIYILHKITPLNNFLLNLYFENLTDELHVLYVLNLHAKFPAN